MHRQGIPRGWNSAQRDAEILKTYLWLEQGTQRFLAVKKQ